MKAMEGVATSNHPLRFSLNQPHALNQFALYDLSPNYIPPLVEETTIASP
ncbi:hypothetical protein CR513_29423, partial [Mucuna pruriens]